MALASVLLIPFAIVLFYRSLTRAYAVPADQDIYTVVQGRWAWTTSDSGCRTDAHTIAFTPDHRVMLITAAHPYKLPDGTPDSVTRYDILRVTRTSIRGAIQGETRMTVDSQPVVWDLVLRAPDRYTWHRTDWAAWEHTREIGRCTED